VARHGTKKPSNTHATRHDDQRRNRPSRGSGQAEHAEQTILCGLCEFCV
jgi:hypothetical protein